MRDRPLSDVQIYALREILMIGKVHPNDIGIGRKTVRSLVKEGFLRQYKDGQVSVTKEGETACQPK